MLTGGQDIKFFRTNKEYKGPPSDQLRWLVTELENGTAEVGCGGNVRVQKLRLQ
jgi:hypothetical protein